jgi:hypothetical protein
MTTDTPRTDAEITCVGIDGDGDAYLHADFARELERELAASKAEVERLKKELDAWDYGTRAKREQEARKKAEAEVAKLNHQLLKTESDLLQSQDINSFLDTEFRIACKLAEKAEAQSESRRQSLAFALNEIKKAEAEVESLREKLDTAIEIAKDALWYARIYENEIHFNKMDGLYQKLVALKNK